MSLQTPTSSESSLGSALDILIDESTMLDEIVSHLVERMKLDIEYLDRLRQLRRRFPSVALPRNGGDNLYLMRRQLVECLDTEISQRKDFIMSITEQVNDAEAFHNSKHSHELLEKSMEDMKEAGHNHLRAKNKARNVLALARVGSEPEVIRELRLPQEDLDYRIAVSTLNASRRQGRSLCLTEYNILIEEHEEYFGRARNAMDRVALGYSNLYRGLVRNSELLRKRTNDVSEFWGSAPIRELIENEQSHEDLEPVPYYNYLAGFEVGVPVFGVYTEHTSAPSTLDDPFVLSRDISEFYLKALKTREADGSRLPAHPQQVVDSAFTLERNFSETTLSEWIQTFNISEIRKLLEFVLINLPRPLVEIPHESVGTLSKTVPRRKMSSILGGQTPEEKTLFQFLCKRFYWDEPLARAVTQRPNTTNIVVDIARKWDFKLDSPKATRF